MCCDSYTENQFIKMELSIIQTIRFNLGTTTTEAFLKSLVFCYGNVFHKMETRSIARFITELALIHIHFLSFSYSCIAEASLLLAYQITDQKVLSGSAEVVACRNALIECLLDIPRAIFKKYQGSDFCRASHLSKIWSDERYFIFK